MEKHSLNSFRERKVLMEKIKRIFTKKEEVVFVIVFGSFLTAPSFRDIDLGIYVRQPKKNKASHYETEIAYEISKVCKLPVDIIDIKLLNFAPSSFLANIFSQGKIIFFRNKKILSDLIEKSSLEAIANEYISIQSLKELIPA